jgi:hypothetical protein
MSKSKLLTKNQLLENFGNPILDPNIYNGGLHAINFDPCNNNIAPNPAGATSVPPPRCSTDIIDNPPAFLDPNIVYKPGEKLTLGATIINGIPLTAWGTMFAGSTQWTQQNIMGNYQWLDAVIQSYFPNGLGVPSQEVEELVLSDVFILKMAPSDSGIGLYVDVEFKLNGNSLIGRFIKWPSVFICDPLNNLNKEEYIKVIGQLKNGLLKWFQVKSGIYVFKGKELIVWTELGQVHRLHDGDVIEVIQSTEDKIMFMHKDIKYAIKKPTYYWFNWMFEKR